MRNVNIKHMLLAGTVTVLLAVSLNVSAVQNPSFSHRVLLNSTASGSAGAPIGDLNNVAWTGSPNVFIDTDNAQTISGTSAVIFVVDAILDYWDDEENVDDDVSEDPAGSDAWKNFDLGGFGAVENGSAPTGAENILIVFEDLPGDILGIADIDYNPATRTIDYVKITIDNEIYDNDDLKNVVAHELGHAIGLSHSGPPYTLMHKFYYSYEAYLRLWISSLKTLDRLYGA